MPITELRVFAYGYGYASFPGGGTSLPLRLEPGEEALIEFRGPWTGGRVRLRVTAVFLDGGAVSHEYKGYVYYYPP